MPNIWYPDTCQCVIDNVNGKFLQRCNLHITSTNWREVQTHNHQPKFQRDGTDNERENQKRQERERIINLRRQPSRIESIEKPSIWARFKGLLHSG